MQLQLIAGRYQMVRAIGHGGMGTVWLCRDEVLGRDVAVKQIGALPGESATETKRAMREARSAAALNHPNAVAIYDVVKHDGRPWLVMEYVEGQTLADEISRDGQISPRRVADIGSQLAGALARAHERRIVHRDIKPGNVLIDRAGRPKISDFGIARRHGDDQLTQVGFITGTPGYLSPELARGGDPHSASDVWALGATLYAAVEGQSPYQPQSNPIAMLRAIATERPRPMTHAGALVPAINAMMHEDPALRWDMATSARRLGGIAADTTAVMPTFTRTPIPTDATAAMPLAGLADTALMAAPADPEDPKGGRQWLPLMLVSLLVVAFGVVLLSQLTGQGGTTAAPGTTVTQAPAKVTAPAPSKPSASPTSNGRAADGTPAAPDRDADKKLEDFVNAYYSEVTKDTDNTWDQLSPNMQSTAGGRESYDDFWHSIDKVKVSQTQANASTGQAVVRLTFTRDDGTRSTETHQFTFVTHDDEYLIESDQLVS